MKEPLVRFDQSLVPDQQSAETAKPCKRPLYNPTMSVPAELSTVLVARPLVCRTSRDDRFNSSLVQAPTKRIVVVSPVGDQSVRIPPRCTRPMGSPYRHVLERRLHESYFRRGRRVQVCSKRSTLAIDQNHPFRALSSFCLADFGPPFFAGAKLPSMKHSSHLIRSASVRFERNALHSSRRVPSSSHFFKRRQQVAGLAYRFGSSLQGAPAKESTDSPRDSDDRRSRSSSFGVWFLLRQMLGNGLPLLIRQVPPGHRPPPCDLRVWSYLSTPFGVFKWLLIRAKMPALGTLTSPDSRPTKPESQGGLPAGISQSVRPSPVRPNLGIEPRLTLATL